MKLEYLPTLKVAIWGSQPGVDNLWLKAETPLALVSGLFKIQVDLEEIESSNHIQSKYQPQRGREWEMQI